MLVNRLEQSAQQRALLAAVAATSVRARIFFGKGLYSAEAVILLGRLQSALLEGSRERRERDDSVSSGVLCPADGAASTCLHVPRPVQCIDGWGCALKLGAVLAFLREALCHREDQPLRPLVLRGCRRPERSGEAQAPVLGSGCVLSASRASAGWWMNQPGSGGELLPRKRGGSQRSSLSNCSVMQTRGSQATEGHGHSDTVAPAQGQTEAGRDLNQTKIQ